MPSRDDAPPPEPRTRLASAARRAAPALAVLLAAGHALHAGWGRWGSLYVDTGRELELPRRILAGERLYGDLQYFYGPLAPYLNALLYRLFGVHLDVLAAAGAASGVAAALTLHAIAARFVGRLAGALAAVTFVYVLGFAHLLPVGIFSFVLPYSFSATYGMLAALLSLLALLVHAGSWRPAAFLASVAFLFLAALAKLEPLVPAVAAHAVFAAAALASRRLARLHAFGWAGAAIATIATYGWLYLHVGPTLLSDNLAGAFNAGSDSYIRQSMGLADLAGNLRAAAVAAALLGATAALGLGAAAVAHRARSAAAKVAAAAAAGIAVLLLALRAGPDGAFRAIPFLATLAFVGAALRWWRVRGAPELRARVLPHVLLAAFTAAASLRIFFAATPEHYGFFLLAPATVWLAVALLDLLPRAAPASAGARWAIGACAAALLLGDAAAAFRGSRASVAESTLAFRSARGTMWAPEGAGEVMPLLELVARSPAEATLLVLPHGTVFNFLLARRGPADGMSEYVPMHFHGVWDAARVVASWERDPPDLVLWHDWTLSDMGGARFGVTYAVEAGRWLLAHYEPVADSGSGIVLLRRRASAPGPAAARGAGREPRAPGASTR